MFRRIFAAALGAGVGIGLLLAALQHVALVPMILEAEKYESGAADPHKHAGLLRQSQLRDAVALSALPVGRPAQAREGATSEPEHAPPLRAVWTWIATTLTSVGFALVLVGAFAVSMREVSAGEGVLWGIAGFAAFSLAPAFALPPELPGAVAGDLHARQIWWVATVAATASGLSLIVFGRAVWMMAIGFVIIAGPHLVGVPHPHEGVGVVPPELAAAFAARSLVVNGVFWALLGWASGALYARLGRVEPA
jgi:cobalt transporter subunit CbtA